MKLYLGFTIGTSFYHLFSLIKLVLVTTSTIPNSRKFQQGWRFNSSSLAHPRRPEKEDEMKPQLPQSLKSLILSKIKLFHPQESATQDFFIQESGTCNGFDCIQTYYTFLWCCHLFAVCDCGMFNSKLQ